MGRLPRSVLVSWVMFVVVLAIGLAKIKAGGLFEISLVLLAILLLAVLGLFRHRGQSWICTACGHRSPPRLRPSGRPRLAVAVPTYNNRATIEDVVDRIGRTAPDLPVLVVDDGSTDGTGALAEAALARRQVENRGEVLYHPKNRGKGAALVTALGHALDAGYSHLIALDGDGQHLPEDLPKLIDAIDEHPNEILVGARDLSDENVQGASRFGRSFSNFWLRVQTGVRLADTQSGYRVYPVAPALSLGCRGRRYDFEVEVLTLGARAGLRPLAVPIGVFYPPPRERVSHFHLFWDNLRISWLNTRLLLGAPLWPLGWPSRLSREPPPSSVVRPWSGRSYGGAMGHLIFVLVLKALGPRPAYLLLYPVCFYFMFRARKNIRALGPFLNLTLGPVGPWRRFWRAYSQVLTFARCILDRAVAQVLGGQPFSMTHEGRQHIDAPGKEGRGLVLLGAHLGNYEVAGALLTRRGVTINLVMMDAEARAIKQVYERMGARDSLPNIIPINKGGFPSLQVLRALRNGEAVAFHGDRVVDDKWVWCDFLGQKAPIATGSFMIAAAAKVPVVLTFGFSEGMLRYRFIAEPPREIELPRDHRDEALQEHAQWYASRIEQWARKYPLQWFNYFDFWAVPAQSSETRRPKSGPGASVARG